MGIHLAFSLSFFHKLAMNETTVDPKRFFYPAQGQWIMNPVIYPQSAGLDKQQLTHWGKGIPVASGSDCLLPK